MVSVRGVPKTSRPQSVQSRRAAAQNYNKARGQRTAAQAKQRNIANTPIRRPGRGGQIDDVDYARFF